MCVRLHETAHCWLAPAPAPNAGPDTLPLLTSSGALVSTKVSGGLPCSRFSFESWNTLGALARPKPLRLQLTAPSMRPTGTQIYSKNSWRVKTNIDKYSVRPLILQEGWAFPMETSNLSFTYCVFDLLHGMDWDKLKGQLIFSDQYYFLVWAEGPFNFSLVQQIS